jgi:hypothetical protein
VNLLDPDGRASCDIILCGQNGSSVTIETDLINAEVDVSALPGTDFGGNHVLSGEGVVLAGLDLVGTFDPTPISDGLAASIYANRGDWLDAAISAAGWIPFVGDLGKLGRLNRIVGAIRLALQRKTANLSRGRHSLITDQADRIVERTGRRNIDIGTPHGIYHYDLRGRPHAGQRTPHVQRSLYHTDPQNVRRPIKDKSYAREMTHQDIRILRKHLDLN